MYELTICINGWVTSMPSNIWRAVGDEIQIVFKVEDQPDETWVGEVSDCQVIPD
jgi:hypothetical protein